MDYKEKNNIIKKFNENVPITEIAKEYGVKKNTIYKRLGRWGIRRRSGIKRLLGKMILELLF